MTSSVTIRKSSMQHIVLYIKYIQVTTKFANTTRHRASTSMYLLTFCVRVMSPERHQWKPAVKAAAVMLRTPPSTASHRPASHAHLRYTAHNFENASVTRRSLISNTRTPRVNEGSRYVVIATQPVHRLQIRPIVHTQLGGSLYHTPSYIRVRAVVWAYGRGQTHRQTDRQTQMRVTTIHFASSTTHAKCN